MYSLSNRNKRIFSIKVGLSIVVACIAIWFFRYYILKGVMTVALPVWQIQETVDDIAREEVYAQITPRRVLVARNEILEKTVETLQARIIELRALEVENRRLREMLGRRETPKVFIPATIYVKPPVSPYDSYVVKAGTEALIPDDALVYAHESIVIGKVLRSYEDYAVIELFSQSEARTNSMLENGTPITVIGQGGGNFISHIPRDVEVEVGQVVRMQDESTLAVLGLIEHIEESAAESSKTLYIRLPINIYRLSYLLIEHE